MEALRKPNPSRLGNAIKGRLQTSQRCVFYGPEGVGKSTLAAFSPEPIWVDCEDGTGHLDVARYEFREEVGGHVPNSLDEVMGAILDLTDNDHDYKTLVIDTADRFEALLYEHILSRDSKPGKVLNGIEDYGYGKGYQTALDQWRVVCARLDTLRMRRGMSIVFLAHASIKPFKNPEGEDYDRFGLRLQEKSAGFLREWADLVGFCQFEEGAGRLDKDQKKAKGFSTGKRLLRMTRTAAFDAKCRLPLPDMVPLEVGNPWAPLAAAIDASRNLTPVQLVGEIDEQLGILGDDELTKKVGHAITNANGDIATLNRYLNELKRRNGESK
jgi:hypothetical protein